jgi:hypothetical protein
MIPQLSEQKIKDALCVARGDLFVAASYLATTPRQLDRLIRSSECVQAFAATIQTIRNDPEYERMSREQFEDELERRACEYQAEALDVIHELAMMPFDTAAMAEVKLKAAIALRGDPNQGKGDTSHSIVLAELNQLYQQSAQRIKSIRVAQVEFQ